MLVLLALLVLVVLVLLWPLLLHKRLLKELRLRLLRLLRLLQLQKLQLQKLQLLLSPPRRRRQLQLQPRVHLDDVSKRVRHRLRRSRRATDVGRRRTRCRAGAATTSGGRRARWQVAILSAVRSQRGGGERWEPLWGPRLTRFGARADVVPGLVAVAAAVKGIPLSRVGAAATAAAATTAAAVVAATTVAADTPTPAPTAAAAGDTVSVKGRQEASHGRRLIRRLVDGAPAAPRD